MSSWRFEVPVIIGLHPGHIETHSLPILETACHVVWYPVKAFSLRMAIVRQGRNDGFPALVLVIETVLFGISISHRQIFGNHIEASKFKILAFQRSEHGPCFVDIPFEGCQLVGYIGEVEFPAIY